MGPGEAVLVRNVAYKKVCEGPCSMKVETTGGMPDVLMGKEDGVSTPVGVPGTAGCDVDDWSTVGTR